jgi:exodeoxyribonuclease VII large subunit
VVNALKDLCDKKVDVIVITRGGGSAADLRWFDDPKIAYAIAQAPVPVIAAIGHHDDRCVAEEVCYQRQKTPTAAADFLVGCFEAARRRIEDASHQLIRGMTRRRDGFAEETARLGEKIGTLAARALDSRKTQWIQLQNQIQRRCVDLLNQAQGVVQQQKNTLYLVASKQITRQKEQLSDLQQHLVQKDPRPWMEQGWTQLTTPQGQNVTRLDQAGAGQRLKARLLDGVLEVEVKGHVSRNSPSQPVTPE